MHGEYHVAVGVTALTFPRNGYGGESAARAIGAHTIGAMTPSTIVLASASLASVTPSDYIVTNNGYWGVVKSADDVTKLVTLLGTWHRHTVALGPTVGNVPTGAASVIIHSGNHSTGGQHGTHHQEGTQIPPQGASFSGVHIRKIFVLTAAAAGAITITDAGGVTTLFLLSIPGAGAAAVHDVNFFSRTPFGLITTGASNAFMVTYDFERD